MSEHRYNSATRKTIALRITLRNGAVRMSDDNIRWERVCEAANQSEAAVLLSLLQGAGLACRLTQETVGALFGLNVGPLGSIGIEVPATELETAKAILAAEFQESDMPE